ncbi:hypothetical protein ANCCAN_18800 [Ancylostoma caninum]|uniref:Uncharacterized protein n=1 Tax=Ancylostoma caninum TaxID=29170 RepID=A0A368FT48_ANCCA|nr:hypothetical protein ANCCAN_18800 [Ancylostoma caninum]
MSRSPTTTTIANMNCLLVLFLVAAEMSLVASVVHQEACSIPRLSEHIEKRLSKHLIHARGDSDHGKYDCELESVAEQKQKDPSYNIPSGLNSIEVE